MSCLKHIYFRVIYLFTLTVFLLDFGGCGIQTSSLKPNVAELLDDLQKRVNLIRQLRVDFVKTRESSAFKEPISARGSLIYQKPDNFFLVYQGDINVQILSNGYWVRIIHDARYSETFSRSGDRNASMLSDPWIDLITGIGRGELQKCLITEKQKEGDLILLELVPRKEGSFERVERMTVWLTYFGEIKKIRVVFTDLDSDEISFDSWSVLLDNDPEIIDLEARLKIMSPN